MRDLRKATPGIRELLTAGKTPEQMRIAIAYVERHYQDGTFREPPHSTWFLKFIIDDALAEAERLHARQEQKTWVDEERARQEQRADEEANAAMTDPKTRQFLIKRQAR